MPAAIRTPALRSLAAACTVAMQSARFVLQSAMEDATARVVGSRPMIGTIVSLVLAGLLEVGGDAAIRRGLVGSGPHWFVVGAVALVAYGFTVNLNREVEFGRLLGAYIAVFFVMSQVIGVAAFGDRPTVSSILGGVLVVAGAVVIQLGAR